MNYYLIHKRSSGGWLWFIFVRWVIREFRKIICFYVVDGSLITFNTLIPTFYIMSLYCTGLLSIYCVFSYSFHLVFGFFFLYSSSYENESMSLGNIYFIVVMFLVLLSIIQILNYVYSKIENLLLTCMLAHLVSSDWHIKIFFQKKVENMKSYFKWYPEFNFSLSAFFKFIAYIEC